MKKIPYILLLVLLVLLVLLALILFQGMYWLALIVLSILVILFSIKTLYIKNVIKWKSITYILVFLILVTITSLIKIFAFEIFKIPSDSMNDTLISGDIILVNKLNYGPNTPRSRLDIPFINRFFYLNNNQNPDSVWWKPKRLAGFQSLHNNDIVVFESPNKNELYLIKRCVAIPGDTIRIEDGQVYINNHIHNNTSSLIRMRYKFRVNNVNKFKSELKKLGIHTSLYQTKAANFFNLELNKAEFEKLNNLPSIDSCTLDILSIYEKPYCFPKNPDFKWNIDQFGPVWIPKKNATIEMNFYNYNLYRKVLNHYEGRKIHPRGDVFFDRDSLITTYTFKNNYFFVMGDNRQNSRDSRYLGFIPEKKIVGEATRILFSNKNGQTKWDRFFKKIK